MIALVKFQNYVRAQRLQCSSDFMNKIQERSNTAFFQPNRLSNWSPSELSFFLTRLYEL